MMEVLALVADEQIIEGLCLSIVTNESFLKDQGDQWKC
jgi:hypothetical protein